MRKLNAVVEPMQDGADWVVTVTDMETAIVEPMQDGAYWIVTVTDTDTKDEYVLTIEAETEKEAAFKAMEQINGQ